MTHDEEQKILFRQFLEKRTFTYWRNRQARDDKSYDCELELIISPTCNTKCSYCYYKNYAYKYTHPVEMATRENIIGNIKKLFKWLKHDNLSPKTIEIFSGEFLNLPYHLEVLELLEQEVTAPTVVILPTNGTFFRSQKLTDYVQDLMNRFNFENSKINIILSLSCDGKYLDNDTRAMRDGTPYTDEFYDRMFKFGAANNFSFHPMVGPKGIERWIDNFDWYIDNIMKYYHIPEQEAFFHIYLLEVRNPDWTEEEFKHLRKFVDHLVERSFNAYDRDPRRYYEEFVSTKNFNFFSGLTSIISRGLGCSIQQCFAVRTGDLALVPCHRSSYKGYNAGYLEIDDEGNMDIRLENPNTYMFINSYDCKNITRCEHCPIRYICSLECIGCNFEVNHDFFTPVESVCQLEYVKNYEIAKKFEEIGILDYVIESFERSSGVEAKGHVTELKNLQKLIKENRQ